MEKEGAEYVEFLGQSGLRKKEVSNLVSQLRKGRIPRNILKAVLDNRNSKILSNFATGGYYADFLKAIRNLEKYEKIDLNVVAEDASKYIINKKGEIPETIPIPPDCSQSETVSNILGKYCILRYWKMEKKYKRQKDK